MKCRHAAALALVGWYLMTPPLARGVIDRGVIEWDAPLTSWKIIGRYETHSECRAVLVGYIEYPEHHPFEKPLPSVPSACVSTDDPRLKGK
jgi:hypothetical protein